MTTLRHEVIESVNHRVIGKPGIHGSDIRFGKYPPKRFAGYLKVPFPYLQIVRFLNHAKINKDILNLYHFSGKWRHVAPVGTDCGQPLSDTALGRNFAPERRGSPQVAQPLGFEAGIPQSPDGFFIIHLNIARCVFSRSKF